MAAVYKVMYIEATVGGGSVFHVENRDEALVLTSTSPVIQAAMLGAFLTGADVEPLTEGTTPAIRRVYAFEAGRGGPPAPAGEYKVNRVATQRGQGDNDHLEVFLLKGNDEKAYNVYDPLLSQLLMAAFQHADRNCPIPFYPTVDDMKLVAVRLGDKL